MKQDPRRALQADPKAFRNALVIDADGGARALGKCIDSFQRKDFEALDESWQRVAGQRKECRYLRAYLERPRGHSKTSDLAVMVTWVLFASSRRLTGVAAAADKDQAKLLRDAVERLVRANRWLQQLLTIDRYRVHNKHTGSELEMISSDAATSYGLTPDFILCDELTHWGNDELWVSLFSAAAKRVNCMLVIISNAGTGCGSSWQWKLREAARLDSGWYFHSLDGPQASWISEKHLAEQRRLLPPQFYDRLWNNIWAAGAGDALREDDIAAAIKLKGPLSGRKPGWVFYAGLDLGLSRDASALAIVGRHVGYEDEPKPKKLEELDDTTRTLIEAGLLESNPLFDHRQLSIASPDAGTIKWHHPSNKLALAYLRVWQPERGKRVKLGPIEAKLVELHRRFNLACVATDPWQAAQLIERARQKGIRAEPIDPNPKNLRAICSEMLEAFNERRLKLFKNDRLLSDLRALRIEEKSYGMRLTSPRGPNGHGDAATALGLALLAAKRRGGGQATRLNRPLLCWP